MSGSRKPAAAARRVGRAARVALQACALLAAPAQAFAANPQQTLLGVYEETSSGACSGDTCKVEFNLRNSDIVVKMMSCQVAFTASTPGSTVKVLVLSEQPLQTIEYVEAPRYIPQANGTQQSYISVNAPMNHVVTTGAKPFFKIVFQQKLGSPAATASCTMAGKVP